MLELAVSRVNLAKAWTYASRSNYKQEGCLLQNQFLNYYTNTKNIHNYHNKTLMNFHVTNWDDI